MRLDLRLDLRRALLGLPLLALPAAHPAAAADRDAEPQVGLELGLSWAQGVGPGLHIGVDPQVALLRNDGWADQLGLRLRGDWTPGHGLGFTALGAAGRVRVTDRTSSDRCGWTANIVGPELLAGYRLGQDRRGAQVGLGTGLSPYALLDGLLGFGPEGLQASGALSARAQPMTGTCVIAGRALRQNDDQRRICEVRFAALGASGPSRGADPAAAARWARRAADELGAVRAFAQLAEDLRAHRAPAALVQAAQRAAAEELAHGRLALTLAAAAAGRPALAFVPAGAPRARPGLGQLAAESALDGALNEAESAAEDRAAAAAAPPHLARALQQVAAEEDGHAALGGAIDRWASAQGPAARRARAAAIERLRAAEGAA